MKTKISKKIRDANEIVADKKGSLIEKNGFKSVFERYINDDMEKTRKFIVMIILVVVAILAVNFPLIFAKGHAVDDLMYVSANKYISNPRISSAISVFTDFTNLGGLRGYYQPLTMLSLMVDKSLKGSVDNMQVYRNTNLLLHLLNVVLLYALLCLLFRRIYLSAFLCVLYGTHPITAQVVAWVAERKTLLGAFFGLLTVIFYVLYKKEKVIWFYVISIVAFLLALLSKPTIMLLPISLVFLDSWPLCLMKQNWISKNEPLIDKNIAKAHKDDSGYNRMLEKMPYLTLSMIIGVFAIKSYQITTLPLAVSFGGRVINSFYNIGFYLVKVIKPFEMTLIVNTPNMVTFKSPLVILGMLITAFVIVICVWAYKKKEQFYNGILFSAVLLLPVIGIWMPTETSSGTKHLYFGGLGLIFVYTYVSIKVLEYISPKIKLKPSMVNVVWIFVAIALIAPPAFAANRYDRLWNDSSTISDYSKAQTPAASVIYDKLESDTKALSKENSTSSPAKDGSPAKDASPSKTGLNFEEPNSSADLGLMYAARNDTEKATEYLLKALNENSNDLEKEIKVAYTLMDLKKHKETLPFWEKRNEQFPNDSAIMSGLAEVYVVDAQYEKAMIYLQKLEKLHPDASQIIKTMAQIYVQLGKYDEATVYANRLMKDKAEEENAKQILVDIAKYSYQSETDAQKERLNTLEPPQKPVLDTVNPQPTDESNPEDLTKVDPEKARRVEEVSAIVKNAEELVAKNDYEGAKTILDKAINDYPDIDNAYISLGVINVKQEKYDEGEKLLKKALELNPSKVFVNHYLGIIYTRTKKYTEAEEAFKRHLAFAPKETSSYFNLGFVYMEKAEYDKAIEMYQKVVELEPNYAEAYYNWSNVYAKKLDIEKAKEMLNKALEIKPDYEAARTALKSLGG